MGALSFVRTSLAVLAPYLEAFSYNTGTKLPGHVPSCIRLPVHVPSLRICTAKVGCLLQVAAACVISVAFLAERCSRFLAVRLVSRFPLSTCEALVAACLSGRPERL